MIRLNREEVFVMVPGQRLLKFGRTQFAKVAYVTFYNNQRMKKVELHKQLFPSGSEVFSDWNRFFEGAFERSVQENIQDRPVFTLGYTDHLFYLICHAFKHFLHSGFGIRQVCDIIMYANAYGGRADWKTITEILP